MANPYPVKIVDVNGETRLAGQADFTDADNRPVSSSGDAIKQFVRVATTGNITLSGLQTVDGVALSVGDRVLVWLQTATSENGIYTAASGAWLRSADCPDYASMRNTLVVSGPDGTDQYQALWQEAGYPPDATFSPIGGLALVPQVNAAATAAGTMEVFAAALVSTRSGQTPSYHGVYPWQVLADGYERTGALAAPADNTILSSEAVNYFDATNGAAKFVRRGKTANGTVVQTIAPMAPPITSGALPTVQLVSGTGAQIALNRDAETTTPCTFNPGAATTATVTVALSPDNVTYSTLGVETEPVGVAFDGTIRLVKVRVPAGWYLKLTANAQAVLGLTTYY